MKISIIVPVFNEAGNLLILNEKLTSVLERLSVDYETIYVDDGSFDASAKELHQIWDNGQKVKIITLIQNYGQTQAISAGIDNSTGEIIVTIDADMQNDPEDIPELLSKLNEGYDVVSGWRINRQDHLLWKKIPSFFANKISGWISGVKLHDLGCTLKAYQRPILEKIDFYGEIHRFLPVYAAMHGAKIAEIKVKHHHRKHGSSKYGMSRIFRVILDMLTIMFMRRFLTRPIYMFGGMGIILMGGAFFTALVIIIRKLFFGGVWVSPLLFLFVTFSTMGIQFIMMGILAELIIRLYHETKSQKRYKIRGIQSR